MTAAEMRELDAWIADNFLDHARVTICEVEDHAVDWFSGYCATCNSEVPKGVEWVPPACSSDPVAFALVKREIEQRGWDWEVNARWQHDLPGVPALVYFQFKIFDSGNKVSDTYTHHNLIGHGAAQTEELAGCRAVQFAMGGGQVIVIDE